MSDAYMLVFSPHPDDSEFGVAGTVAKLTDQGKKVVYAVVTDGSKGTGDPETDLAELVRTREREQQAAADVLGVSEVVFMHYPDQGLEDTPEFRRDIVRVIRRFKPEVVVSGDPYRRYFWHRDHRITGTVVLDAVFPYARDYHSYPELISEGLMPHKVKEIWLWGAEDVNLRHDVTDAYDRKLKALLCHDSQVGRRPVEDMERFMLQRLRENAESEPYELAEGFHRVVMPG
ncbi:PIG-L deacetylase family protein [Chloroflexota bacterium]